MSAARPTTMSVTCNFCGAETNRASAILIRDSFAGLPGKSWACKTCQDFAAEASR